MDTTSIPSLPPKNPLRKLTDFESTLNHEGNNPSANKKSVGSKSLIQKPGINKTKIVRSVTQNFNGKKSAIEIEQETLTELS